VETAIHITRGHQLRTGSVCDQTNGSFSCVKQNTISLRDQAPSHRISRRSDYN